MTVFEDVKEGLEEAVNGEGTTSVYARIDLKFDALQAWRDTDNNNIPICSFLALYRASGVQEELAKLREQRVELPDKLVPLDNLACNFYTFQRMRNLIQKNWEYYALDIDGDNHVFWDPKRPNHKRAAKKKIKTKIYQSINMDCLNFCPSVDDNLPDNILVIRPTPEVPEKSEQVKSVETEN